MSNLKYQFDIRYILCPGKKVTNEELFELILNHEHICVSLNWLLIFIGEPILL